VTSSILRKDLVEVFQVQTGRTGLVRPSLRREGYRRGYKKGRDRREEVSL
jgi:hypothetical protein